MVKLSKSAFSELFKRFRSKSLETIITSIQRRPEPILYLTMEHFCNFNKTKNLKRKKIFCAFCSITLLTFLQFITFVIIKLPNKFSFAQENQTVLKTVRKSFDFMSVNSLTAKLTASRNITFFKKSYCPSNFGDIAIFTLITNGSYKLEVNNALVSIKCYSKMRGYKYYLFTFDEETKTLSPNANSSLNKSCLQLQLMFLRHCLVLSVLPFHDYVIHIDGDTGVVNPHHCFEEYIIPGVDVFHLERFHSGEIQAGHYIVKNTDFSKTYLRRLIDTKDRFKKYIPDNPLIYFPLSENTMTVHQWSQCRELFNNVSYEIFKRCVKKQWGKQRLFKNIIIFRRGHDFARDGWLTKFAWSEVDFMLHAMKYQDDVLFTRKLSPEDCSTEDEWHLPLKSYFYIPNIDVMREIWLKTDIRENFAYDETDALKCWPNCPYNLE